MADQWYYAQQGQRQGPVSEEQLKQLASSGELKPTDKVWKKGMAAWEAASAVEGLFPKPAKNEPPPVEFSEEQGQLPQSLDFLSHTAQQGQGVKVKAKGMAASLFQRGKNAAHLVAKQAERTKLVNMTLPAAYQALGKQVHGAGSYRDEFAETFKKIDGPLTEIAALQAHSAAAPKAEGFAAKAKSAVDATTDMAHVQALKLKLSHSFTELGKAVFEKHGTESGPEAVVRPILDCRARLEKLDSEIKGLSQSEPGQVLTPRRLAVGGLALAALLLIFALRGMFFGAGNSRPELASGEPARGTAKSTAAVETWETAKKAGPTKEDLARVEARVKEGDQLWDQDKKAEAVGKYMALVNGSKDTLDHETYGRLLARTVDYLVDGDDISTDNC